MLMANGIRLAEEDKFTPIGEQMSRWMDQVLGGSFRHYSSSDVWKPAINLCEHADYYCLVAELAGMQAGEIDLRVEDGTLFLTGERATPSDPRDEGAVKLHLMEIDHGRFLREVKLPADADLDAIEATYRSGYLRVKIPRKKVV
jgi:HSP20 family protein